MSTAPVGNNVNPLSWLSVLNEVNGTTNAEAAQQVSDSNRSVTFTATVNGVVTTVTMKVPDDLDLPSEVTPEAIDNLMAKLVAGDFNLTQTQLLAIKSSITKTYTQMACALATVQSGSTGRVMCDLYQLMALLVEVAQSQRNAARDLRNSQNQQIQNSIQAQADSQRNAAIVGLVVGVTCGVISAAVSVGMLAGQGAAYKTQVNAARASGMEAAQSKVTMLQNADTPEHAQAQFNKVSTEKGMPTGKALDDFTAQIDGDKNVVKARQGFEASQAANELSGAKAKSEAADTKLADTQKALDSAKDEYLSACGENVSASEDLKTYALEHGIPEERLAGTPREALARYESYIENSKVGDAAIPRDETLVAKFNKAIAAQDRVETASAEVETQTLALDEAKAAQQTAAADLSKAQTKAEQTAAAAGLKEGEKPMDLEKARAEYRAALENVADDYTEKYNSAVSSGASKSEIAQAKNEMRLARAYVNNEIMKDPALQTRPTEYKEALTQAREEASAMGRALDQNIDYRGALRRIETLGGINAINTAIGNMLQSMTQSISGSINSEATRMGAEQQKEQEQLDQTKDLFNQAQSVVDAAVQLMNAVRQAETQSMRDAIQA